MTLLRDVVDAVKALPNALGDGMDRWLMEVHQPAWTDEPGAPCRNCKNAWPCDGYIVAAERRAFRKTP